MVPAAKATILFIGQNPCLKVAFISALTVFPKGCYGLAGENAELQRREVVCPGHTAGRRLGWDWNDGLDDSKTCFLPGDFSVCSISSTLLTGKIKARPQCRAQTFQAAPSLPSLGSPLRPARASWWGTAQGGSLDLARPLDQAGAVPPQVTRRVRGCPQNPHREASPPQTQEPQRTGSSYSWASPRRTPSLNHPQPGADPASLRLQGRPQASARLEYSACPDCPARVEAGFPASTRRQGCWLEPHCMQTPCGGRGTGLTSPPHETFHLCC